MNNDNPMFAKFDQALGKTTPTTSAGPVSSRADEIRALATSTTATHDNPAVETAKNFGSQIVQAKDKIASSVTEGADTIKKGGVVNTGKGVLQAGLGTAAGGVEAIFAPISAAMKTLLDHTASANAQHAAEGNPDPAFHGDSPQAQQARDQIAQFAQAHPDLARVLGDAFTVGGAVIGGEAAGILDKPVGDLAASAKQTVTEGAAKMKAALPEKLGGAPNPAKTSQGVLDAIRQTEDTMTPTMKKAAIDEGRQTVSKTATGGTKVDYAPTPEIQRASEILQDKNVLPNPVTPKDEPHVVLAKTKSAISRLGQKAETYLEENPVKITNNEDFKMFQDLRTKADKVSTPTEMAAYDEQIKLFNKQLQGRGGYTTANYYKGLKDWEQNIAEKLPRGKEALIDPTGVANAKLRAASDIRQAVRELISSKHPEFKSQMYDIASLYEAKDVAIQNASKVKSQTLTEKHPTATKALKYGIGGGLLLEGGHALGL